MHDAIGLLTIAGAVVEDVTVRRIVTQQRCPGKGAEEQRAMRHRIRQGRCRRRRTDITDETEYAILLEELLHGVRRARRFVAVVGRDELQPAPVDTSGIVGGRKRRLDPDPHLLSQLGRRAGEGSDDSEADFTVRHAAISGVGGSRGRRRRRRGRNGGRGGGDWRCRFSRGRGCRRYCAARGLQQRRRQVFPVREIARRVPAIGLPPCHSQTAEKHPLLEGASHGTGFVGFRGEFPGRFQEAVCQSLDARS